MNNENKTMLINLTKDEIKKLSKNLDSEIEKVRLYMPEEEFINVFDNCHKTLEMLNNEIIELRKRSVTQKF